VGAAGGDEPAGSVSALSAKLPARLCGDQGGRDTPAWSTSPMEGPINA
jgi:hypothetical protein